MRYASKSWHNADSATLDSENLSCMSYASTTIIRALLLLLIEDRIWQGSPECPKHGHVAPPKSKVFMGFTQRWTVQPTAR